jgi:hypothetical protein
MKSKFIRRLERAIERAEMRDMRKIELERTGKIPVIGKKLPLQDLPVALHPRQLRAIGFY